MKTSKLIQQTSKELGLNPNLFETAFFDLIQEGEINKIFDKYTDKY